MRMLTSQSSRFTRSQSYTAPEYRASSLHQARTRLNLVAPNHPVRGKEKTAEAPRRQG
jgi:hypothetical protein